MKREPEVKSTRMLAIYARLLTGEVMSKRELSEEYNVSMRSIQRDMEALRTFLNDQGFAQDVIYDGRVGGYMLVNNALKGLTNSEVLAVCKILLESRSLRKDELFPILDKLIDCTVSRQNRKALAELIANEKYHYCAPHHGQPILSHLWEIAQAVQHHQRMEIEYERIKEPQNVKRTIQPVGIMFSEYYFYLTAFLEDKSNFKDPDDLFPTIYRIDRIRSFTILQEHFHVRYTSRFEEGEFRKRVQFMYGGRLQTVHFRYTGPSLEAVLDRLPTARIIREDDEGWVISAEVFGNGIDMWLRSQGDSIQLLDK